MNKVSAYCRLNPQSSKALLIVGGLFLILGFVILTPSARFLCLILGMVCEAIPVLFSTKRHRLIAVLLLALSLATAVWIYPEFKNHMTAYGRSVRTQTQ